MALDLMLLTTEKVADSLNPIAIKHFGEKATVIVEAIKDRGYTRFTLNLGDLGNGTFYCQQLLGCCGVMVCGGVNNYIYGERYTKFYEYVTESAKKVMELTGYTTLIMTDQVAKKSAQEAFKTSSFSEIHRFRNRRTSNQVTINIFDSTKEDT